MSQARVPFLGEKPDFNELEQELARCEQSWCDFAYSLRRMHRIQCGDSGVVESLRCMSFVDVKEQFDAYKKRLEEGDPSALVGALNYACEEGVPLPYWLASEIRTRLKRVFDTYETLGEAFGLAALLPEKGKKARNARRYFQLRKHLWVDVRLAMKGKSLSLTKALRAAIKSGKYPFGESTARKLYNTQERIQKSSLPRSQG